MKTTFPATLFALIFLLTSSTSWAEDPYQVDWIQQIGTSSADASYSVAVDGSGNTYISGYTDGSLEGTSAGRRDAFLTKFDNSGNELWTQQIGTSSDDISHSIAIDGLGNAYISGYIRNGLVRGPDSFLTKFDSNGVEQWNQQIGSTSYDISDSVAVDGLGNAYISGRTNGDLEGTNEGRYDAFLTKFNNNGTKLWTQQIGTSAVDKSHSVAVDSSNNIYISGFTSGDLEGTNEGSYDAFLTKFNNNGTELWTQQIGTSEDDLSFSVAVDDLGNAFISGRTEGNLEGTNAGGEDVFLTKFDSSGAELWTQQIGTSSDDQSRSVAVDSSGNAYISGYTFGKLGEKNEGHYDAFLTKYHSNGTELWTQQIGTSSDDRSFSVAVDDSGNAYISGRTNGSLGGANAGSYDAFVVKFSPVPEPSSLLLAAFATVGLLLRWKRTS